MAAYSAVNAPMYAMVCNTPGANSMNSGNILAVRNTPATTIVAACMSAETGVGPSIASGNHICRGNIALFPAPPMNISIRAVGSTVPAAASAVSPGVNENVSM